MNFTLIDLKVESTIATITLNRPDKRNAMSDDMRSEFIDALERVAADKAIKALVLTGAGKGFCAGGDIAGMERRMNAPAGEVGFNGWHRQQRVHHTQALLHTMPKPVIAAVNGAASGLGADTALACDFIIASEWANFTWSLHPPRHHPRRRRHVLPAAPRRPAEGQGADLHRPQGRCRRSAGAGHRRPQDIGGHAGRRRAGLGGRTGQGLRPPRSR